MVLDYFFGAIQNMCGLGFRENVVKTFVMVSLGIVTTNQPTA